MAAAKTFGAKEFAKLDPLTVSMTPPDATVALLKGGAQITAAFSVPPFQYHAARRQPGIHTVLNSFDVMGGSHTFTAAWTSAKFRDGNPVLYKAFIAALKEATDIVNKDKQAASGLVDRGFQIEAAARHGRQDRRRPAGALDLVPENTMKFADFMASVGTLKVKAASWKDYFFPEIYDLNGS